MKKTLSLLLALVFVFLLAGCGKTAAISRGSINGNVYSNEYLDFKFAKPDTWKYYTDEEIAAAMNMGEEIMDEDFKDALKKSSSIYDMMAVDPQTGSNINIGYESLSKTFYSLVSIDQYIASLKTKLQDVAGMTVKFSDDYDKVKLGEHKYTRVICSTYMSGSTFTQVYYLRKVGRYMAFAIVTIVKDYSVSQIEAMFS